MDFASVHSAIIALTPVAAQQASLLAPRIKLAHLGWGADLRSYRQVGYSPKYFLHCGIAGRDFRTLNEAALQCSQPIRIISAGPLDQFRWPEHVEVIDGGKAYNHEEKKVPFTELVNTHYAGSAASLIVTVPNPGKNHAFGFTNLIEALAMGQPIIHTATGALSDEIDVEKAGCGLAVPPENPAALAAALNTIMNDSARAREMGGVSRALCETHYNIERYARDLHVLFESL